MSNSEETQSAVVVRVDSGSCLLITPDGAVFEAAYRGKLFDRPASSGAPLVVGDQVRVETFSGDSIVAGVEPRRNWFSRRASGERLLEQTVAANLDQVVVVVSVVDPEFKAGFADRVLCQAEHAGIPARMVVTKMDLDSEGRVAEILADYSRAGYPGHAVDARSGDGVDAVRKACIGRRSLFVGHSGVGKSTLLNTLVPGLGLIAGAVNVKTGKGKHTTSAAWLLRPEPELELIDTPGVRVFGLWGIHSRDLEQSYAEFRRYLGLCRFTNCAHDREPGCAIREAVASGDVAERRLVSFHGLRSELEREEIRR